MTPPRLGAEADAWRGLARRNTVRGELARLRIEQGQLHEAVIRLTDEVAELRDEALRERVEHTLGRAAAPGRGRFAIERASGQTS